MLVARRNVSRSVLMMEILAGVFMLKGGVSNFINVTILK